MKFLVIGDCHGESPEIDEGDVEEADAILCVGDFCGGGEEMRSLMFESMDEDWEWYEEMGEGKAREAVIESIKEGRDILEYLNSFGKPVYVVPGNWDWSGEIYSNWDFLQDNKFQDMVEGLENVHNINFDLVQNGEFGIIGYGPCSGPELPQYEDDEPETEEERERIERDYMKNKADLKDLFEEAEGKIIFLSHNVPFETDLDQIDNPESPVHGRHYGSIVVRELIEEESPLISIGGHMHEGYGRDKVGEALCLNTGLGSYIVLEIEQEGTELEFNPLVEQYHQDR